MSSVKSESELYYRPSQSDFPLVSHKSKNLFFAVGIAHFDKYWKDFQKQRCQIYNKIFNMIVTNPKNANWFFSHIEIVEFLKHYFEKKNKYFNNKVHTLHT